MEEHEAAEIVMSVVRKDLQLKGEVNPDHCFQENLGGDSLDILEVQIDVAETAERQLGRYVDADSLEIYKNNTVNKLTAALMVQVGL